MKGAYRATWTRDQGFGGVSGGGAFTLNPTLLLTKQVGLWGQIKRSAKIDP